MQSKHVPVMVAEVLRLLEPHTGQLLADLTVGPGGHAEALLEHSAPDGRVLCVDVDGEAIALARRRLAPFGDRASFCRRSYAELPAILEELRLPAPDGCLLDAGGVSSDQLADPARGFSYQVDGPLDARFRQAEGSPTAAELVNTLSQEELARIFRIGGETRRAAQAIAAQIIAARRAQPIHTTQQLARLVAAGVTAVRPGPTRKPIARRAFLGLRLALNTEIPTLLEGVRAALCCLPPGGRLVVLTYHSGEHGPVRRLLRELERGCVCPPALPRCGCGRQPVLRQLVRKPLFPTPEEVARNSAAASARLHAVVRAAGSL